MTFPIRCFTCGNVISDKYRYYQKQVRSRSKNNDNKAMYFTASTTTHDKSIHGQILDELELTNMCCRTKFLTHVDVD